MTGSPDYCTWRFPVYNSTPSIESSVLLWAYVLLVQKTFNNPRVQIFPLGQRRKDIPDPFTSLNTPVRSILSQCPLTWVFYALTVALSFSSYLLRQYLSLLLFHPWDHSQPLSLLCPNLCCFIGPEESCSHSLIMDNIWDKQSGKTTKRIYKV